MPSRRISLSETMNRDGPHISRKLNSFLCEHLQADEVSEEISDGKSITKIEAALW